ncbi:MAG: hypothetical protein AAB588_01730 [Patescibacteria group bacterium]
MSLERFSSYVRALTAVAALALPIAGCGEETAKAVEATCPGTVDGNNNIAPGLDESKIFFAFNNPRLAISFAAPNFPSCAAPLTVSANLKITRLEQGEVDPATGQPTQFEVAEEVAFGSPVMIFDSPVEGTEQTIVINGLVPPQTADVMGFILTVSDAQERAWVSPPQMVQ